MALAARLDASRIGDFFRLHSAENGAGWCRCVAWWVGSFEGWGERTEAQNRAVRDALHAGGTFDGYLFYDGSEPVGWCQAVERDRLGHLVRRFGLAPAPGTWAIACFLVAPGRRRQGLAGELLRQVLADLATAGVRRVEAFPRRGASEAHELWNGPERLFLEAGFAVVVDDVVRPVLALDLP